MLYLSPRVAQVFSANPEFCRPFTQTFFDAHGIKMAERPSRSSHKNGAAESNNGTFNPVLNNMSRETTAATPATVVAKASLVTNLLHGSFTLNPSQLARGYSTSVLCIPSSNVPEDLIEAHVYMKALRAIQKVITSRSPLTTLPAALYPGRAVWVVYKSSQQNIPVHWVEARVVKA